MEKDPIRARFGRDKAPQLAGDAEELNKEQMRNREKDRDTWHAVDGVDDPDMNNPYIVQG